MDGAFDAHLIDRFTKHGLQYPGFLIIIGFHFEVAWHWN
jgi:hypothetical protein